MGKVRGVKNGDILSSSFDGRIKKNFKNIHETKVLLLVSIIGNEFCTGEYLQASIATAVQKHEEATVLIADEVYWNNLISENHLTDEKIQELKNKALNLGEQFIAKNMVHILKGLGLDSIEFEKHYGSLGLSEQLEKLHELAAEKGIRFSLQRWAEWTDTPDLNIAGMSRVMNLNSKMQDSIEATAKDFADRHKDEESSEVWLTRSRAYLKEETPAVIWLAAKRGYHFIAYPGEEIAPFGTARELFINPEGSDDIDPELIIRTDSSLANWLDINFRRSKSKQLLFTQSLINAPSSSSMAASSSSGASSSSSLSSFFSKNVPFQGSGEEQRVVELAKSIISAPGDNEFKLNVLLEVFSTLGSHGYEKSSPRNIMSR